MNYYTPILSEFHVDFIYERVDESGYAVSQVVMPTTPLSAIQQLLDEGSIRVKCLDEDDIEALGFRAGNPHEGKRGPLTDTDEQVFSFPGSLFILVLRKSYDASFISIYDVEQMLGPSTYRGECKNINELERILQRLSIHQPVQYASN